ncbi:MAG: hypothetical protein OEN56_11595 [Gemmatimonadota bacterium]|nr:hypothetical protein [Gemmatimonadota bacterium]
MRRTVECTVLLSLATTLTLAGCAQTTLPTAAEQSTAFFTHAPAPGFEVSRRDIPLAEDVSITTTIGSEGGRIDLARAGVTLLIPANAVNRPTEITVRALAGDALAFDVAPHGLELNEPASILVRISGTSLEESVGGLTGPLPGYATASG